VLPDQLHRPPRGRVGGSGSLWCTSVLSPEVLRLPP
jgi:hypothetical protein